MKEICKLCGKSDALRDSHVVPRFVGKYLKDTGATGYLTAIDNEGKANRSQDLSKLKLLCSDCELILNDAETFFANKIFHPFQKGTLNSIPIDERLSRFAVSVSLRALWVIQITQQALAEKWETQLTQLEGEWKDYLLSSPGFAKGENSHHILLCDEALLAIGLKNNPNLIHSVMRTSAYYLFEKFDKSYVFANLAGIQIISMISPAELPSSQGTQVYPDQEFGIVAPPGIGWGGYYQNLIELARKVDEGMSRLSEREKERINRAMTSDRAKKSEDARILTKQRKLGKKVR